MTAPPIALTRALHSRALQDAAEHGRVVDGKGLAGLCGASTTSVHGWKKQGMPTCGISHNTRPPSALYDCARVLSWIEGSLAAKPVATVSAKNTASRHADPRRRVLDGTYPIDELAHAFADATEEELRGCWLASLADTLSRERDLDTGSLRHLVRALLVVRMRLCPTRKDRTEYAGMLSGPPYRG